jgi:hypothetical protein
MLSIVTSYFYSVSQGRLVRDSPIGDRWKRETHLQRMDGRPSGQALRTVPLRYPTASLSASPEFRLGMVPTGSEPSTFPDSKRAERAMITDVLL